jgi:hypothetical protein
MRHWLSLGLILVFILSASSGFGASAAKQHVISFGKTLQVKLFVGPSEDKTLDMKVRPLLVDSKIKEFTTGEAHDVTDRLFAVRRAFRVNDNLPVVEGAPVGQRKMPKWLWQRGGWLLVDRLTGRISQVNLPDFDPFYSEAVWFRDYVAYCGVSDNAEKLYAVVTQLGRKKVILRKELGPASNGDLPDSECAAPVWERQPVRVTFNPQKGEKITYTVRGHAADVAPGSDEE